MLVSMLRGRFFGRFGRWDAATFGVQLTIDSGVPSVRYRGIKGIYWSPRWSQAAQLSELCSSSGMPVERHKFKRVFGGAKLYMLVVSRAQLARQVRPEEPLLSLGNSKASVE